MARAKDCRTCLFLERCPTVQPCASCLDEATYGHGHVHYYPANSGSLGYRFRAAAVIGALCGFAALAYYISVSS